MVCYRCVTNEKLISPFRGTYNADDGHQVTLYAYLKAFRFTGSPALYLECDIHMCHNKCPVSRCIMHERVGKREQRGRGDWVVRVFDVGVYHQLGFCPGPSMSISHQARYWLRMDYPLIIFIGFAIFIAFCHLIHPASKMLLEKSFKEICDRWWGR